MPQLLQAVRQKIPADPDVMLAGVASVIAGVFVALMIRLNATLGEHVGVLESSFLVHLVGTVFAALLVLPRSGPLLPSRLRSAPRYTFLGGVLGVAIVMLANIVVPVLGVALTLCLSVAANLGFSTISDHFGWFGLPQFPVSKQRLLGLALVILGVVLVAFG
ncbi:hypothetical protein CRI94_13825 [Longibacter salinarum]|uniref:EamA-like transporter family protein n=1 Tax=Longibacter salinarum TaxID=1850348 RepID=A0A2A8CV73_9BACT|nr:DMT family transporter [Longibacter salinarum]PEN12592.1 hypothetical protein CRI94_13825 [Longibacter salinarum]